MANKTKPASAGRKRFEVVYEGRYNAVVDYGRPALVAHASDDPEMDEKEYVLRMVDELLTAHDEIFKGGERRVIRVGVVLKHGGMRYTLSVDTTGDVKILPLTDGYVDFIRGADGVEMSVVGRDVERDFKARRGRYAVVVEYEGGLLHAFGRKDVRLRSDKLMLAIIREMLDMFEDLGGSQAVRAVAVHGLVWRNNAAFLPLIYPDSRVEFWQRKGDYVDFVKGAEGVVFI